MHLLLRKQTQDRQGRDSVIDIEIAADNVRVGADPALEIQLLGGEIAAEHIVLNSDGNGVLNFACNRGASITVEGKKVTKGTLPIGARFEIGRHHFDVIKPPAGFDAALAWVPDIAAVDSSLQAAYKTRLDQTFLAKRWPALVLLALTLLVSLALPLGSYLMRDVKGSSALALDSLWSSGPLLPAHQTIIGDQCGACHVNGFQMVRDNACTTCHTNLPDHVDFAAMPVPELRQTRCASCHREHNEPHSLVVMTDSLCTDCHRDPAAHSSAKISASSVTRFTQGQHPDFNWHLIVPQRHAAGTGEVVDWTQQRVAREQNPPEQSNLKFPHDVHLDGSKVLSLETGDVLHCDSCHVLSADREHFEPITMEGSCRSCHDLSFDRREPQKQLPHGAPAKVITAMEEHFLRSYLMPKPDNTPQRRRLPDRDDSEEQCTSGALPCAKQQTEREAQRQFTQRGCVTCHDVVDTQIDDLYNRFQVLPVRLSRDWYPKAMFDHQAHLTQQNADANARCTSCHAAGKSNKASDKLIPGIENCMQCHDSAGHKDQIELNCVSCHDFHLHEQPMPTTATSNKEST